ncbi:MAG: hypothetical protein GY801_10170 [bacterium]|nr:hypothetical protein [bacterium]
MICFLQEIGNQLGHDRREVSHTFCKQLQTQLKPRPIAALKSQRPISYLAPFQAPPLPQHFVPRPEVTDALKERLLNNEAITPGILVVSAIHGLGGIGKSTLAAALTYDKDVQERFPDGILWATLGQQPEILSLISGWIHEMRDYDFRPTTIEAASAHLRTLLQDKAVLLVVDDVWNPEHAIHFKVCGPGCQVLITTRRADVADEVGAELHQMDVMTPKQSLKLLAARLQRPIEITERDKALALAEAVGYLPLALELASVRVARGMSWTTLCGALEQETANLNALEGSPRRRRKGATTLEACFNFSLNALREEDEEAWNAFVWLGVLPEDVLIAAPMAATLWEKEQIEAHDLLELLWNDALLLPGSPILIGDKEYPAYRLHDLLHDIARKLLTTNQLQGLGLILHDANATLLERYKQYTQNNLWHTLPDDGYIHSHLTWHFQQADQIEQIHALLHEETEEGNNGWFQIRERLGQAPGFIEDVDTAMQFAEQERKIGLQCRYTLMLASFKSMAQNIPTELLVLLVKHKIWSPAQGLIYAHQHPFAEEQIEYFIELSPYLPQTLRDIALQYALTAAQASNSEYRPVALTELIPYLKDSQRESALQDALTAAQAINSKYRTVALTELIPYLKDSQRESVLQEALTAARAIKDEEDRAAALTGLAPHLPDAWLQEALTMAQTIENEWVRTNFLIRLAPYLPETLRKTALQEALTAAQMMESEWYRAETLTGLAPFLPDSLRETVVREALAAALAVNDHSKIETLTELAPHLPDSLRETALKEALTAARELEHENSRATFLTFLVPHMSGLLREKCLTEALTVIQTIKDEWRRAEDLVTLAPHLPDSLRKTVLQEAFTAARAIEDEEERVWALSNLAPHLPDLLRKAALQEAMITTQAIEDEGERAWALGEMAPQLSDTLLQEALHCGPDD